MKETSSLPPPPVEGSMQCVLHEGGRVALWGDARGWMAGRPLLLIHSVNAAASAYEVRPIFQHYAGLRPIYALELPGFGHSDKTDRAYTVRVMTDAVHQAVAAINAEGGGTVDVIAVSLSCEFLARAAHEKPEGFRTLGFISPTGFDKNASTNVMRRAGGFSWLHAALNARVWSAGLFRLMMRRSVIRLFLSKTWGSRQIDEGLLDYDCRLARQPGAQHAPYYFISGFLFSARILDIYKSLRMPVWMVHGVRGDFVDYTEKRAVEGSENWTIDVFQTGAFPQFETLAALVESYERFLGAAMKPEFELLPEAAPSADPRPGSTILQRSA